VRIPEREILVGIGQFEVSVGVGFSRLQYIVFVEKRIKINGGYGEVRDAIIRSGENDTTFYPFICHLLVLRTFLIVISSGSWCIPVTFPRKQRDLMTSRIPTQIGFELRD
jgi:hypothetical protein